MQSSRGNVVMSTAAISLGVNLKTVLRRGVVMILHAIISGPVASHSHQVGTEHTRLSLDHEAVGEENIVSRRFHPTAGLRGTSRA